MPARYRLDCGERVFEWKDAEQPETEWDDTLPATFIVDLDYQMWFANRRSEHVACARVKPVLAAGEVFFEKVGNTFQVARITNQSTGYCPEPSSFPAVERALRSAGFECPHGYDPEFVFRLCVPCENICIVKDDDFTCPMCSRELPVEWNFAPTSLGQ